MKFSNNLPEKQHEKQIKNEAVIIIYTKRILSYSARQNYNDDFAFDADYSNYFVWFCRRYALSKLFLVGHLSLL